MRSRAASKRYRDKDGGSSGPPASPERIEAHAQDIVYRQLGMMARSHAQLRTKLLDRGIPEDIADRVLERFVAAGLIDDRAFAEMFIRTQRESRGLSKRALVYELERRGVSREIAEESLEDIDDEYEVALRFAQKKSSSLRGVETRTAERRLAGMLARKGYGASITYRVVREVLGN